MQSIPFTVIFSKKGIIYSNQHAYVWLMAKPEPIKSIHDSGKKGKVAIKYEKLGRISNRCGVGHDYRKHTFHYAHAIFDLTFVDAFRLCNIEKEILTMIPFVLGLRSWPSRSFRLYTSKTVFVVIIVDYINI